MNSAVHDVIINEPSTKDKSNIDADKTTKEKPVKGKATKALGCRKSGNSVQKVSKQRCKTTGGTLELEQCADMKSLSSSLSQVTMQASDNNNEYCLHLPSTPLLHPKSPVMASSTKNTPLKVLKPIRAQSPRQFRKCQLQLFPIDEPTRKSLEEENHCPYLELTITTKKKIASIIRHLNLKWGNSRGALGELVLFPFNARVESLESFERWSLMDSYITVAEVHDAIGKPAVFRLRYGWLNLLDPKITDTQTSLNLAIQSSSEGVPKEEVVDQMTQLSSGASQFCEPFPAKIFHKQSISGTYPMKSIKAADNLRSENDANLSLVDSVSNMSFGALFSAVADDGDKVCLQVPQHLIPISCDSFDAAIATHIARYQTGNQSTTMAQPSILDAEETRNTFSFHSFTSNKYVQHHSANASSQTTELHNMKLHKALSPLLEHAHGDGCVPSNTTLTFEDDARPTREEDAQLVVDLQGHKQIEKEEMQVIGNATNTVNNQFEGLDIHWPPSVGPWQFDAAPSQQMINSDSNGLIGFVSTRMDIFEKSSSQFLC